jgi:hypothetical protein
VNWVRSGYSNYLVYCIRFWSLKNSSSNCNFRKKSQTWCCAQTHYGVICKKFQQFSLKFHKKHAMQKNPEIFYGQILTNFSFSEFWITDFRHKKKILKFCHVNSHKDFWEFILTKICDSKFWKIKISENQGPGADPVWRAVFVLCIHH